MKRNLIAIDFAGRRAPSRWPAVLVLGVVLSASAAWAAWQMHAHRTALESQVSEAVVSDERPAATLSDEQKRALDDALEAIDFPWPALMSRIERHAARPGLRLTALDVRAAGGEVKLAGTAADSATVLAFAEALRREPLLSGLRLTRQDAPGDGAAGVPFTMEGRLPASTAPGVTP
jgi:hypothetical protein